MTSATMNETDKERAGALIGAAMQEHDKIARSTSKMLGYAIAAGEKLLEARGLYKGEGAWRTKLKSSWTCSSTRTADRYMVLATHAEEVQAAFDTVSNSDAEKWTLRDAIAYAEDLQRKAKLAALTEEQRKAREAKKAADERAAAAKAKPEPAKPSTAATPDPHSIVKDLSADEVATVVKKEWTTTDQEKLAKSILGDQPDLDEQLRDYGTPEDIVDLLFEAFREDPSKLHEIFQWLDERLKHPETARAA